MSRTEERGASPGSDAALLVRVGAGDAQAFERLAERHYDRCYRIAARLLADRAEAEDVAQDVFLKLWTSSARVHEPGALAAYLARMAANLSLDRLRRKRPDLPGELPDVADAAAAADAGLRRAAVQAQVDDAIAGLPDRQRAALVLVHFEGFGNADAAAMLDVSVDALESLLARARRTLKATLAGTWRELLDDASRL